MNVGRHKPFMGGNDLPHAYLITALHDNARRSAQVLGYGNRNYFR